MARFEYMELPVSDRGEAKRFYAQAFGWTFTDFGPDYAATLSGDTDLGLDASPDKVKAPLPVIRVEDLEATLAAVEAAGGTIVVPIFAFPGGRRFHFRDVDGHELAAMQPG
ncbi:VOC family protein [Sphingomonas sp. Leaf21]|uniref:VOC family protein n=1 Tax=Sphingomonas sp. Leaf21 TaxID=2876550 RepID=UPI001E2E55B9|nr:VOC family protein [Sphingomonas sp. Leaf21]